MSLTGTALVSLLVLLALGLPVALALLWSRARTKDRRHRGFGHAAFLIVGVLVCQALAVAAAGIVANDQFGFYNSWVDLTGTGNQATQVPTANGLVPPDGSEGKVLTISVTLPGHDARQQMSVLVWVPKQYDDPQYHDTKFPVTMMLPGQPGTPRAVFNEFLFGQQATLAIDQHKVRPFVAVFPPIMIDPPRDTECTNVPHGPQAEAWLYDNVRQAVIRQFRVSSNGSEWSAMGWSTGGFCAAKLTFMHRNLFGAAVGIGAYYDAETDHGTGDLFGHSQKLRNANSPIMLVRQPELAKVRLLIVASRFDRDSWNGVFYADSYKMILATRGLPGVATLELPQGGHNYALYRPTIPTSLAWLGKNAGL